MKKKEIASARAACVEAPATTVGAVAPISPTVIVIVVLLLNAVLTLDGMTAQAAATTLATGGLLGIELVRRLVEKLTNRRPS